MSPPWHGTLSSNTRCQVLTPCEGTQPAPATCASPGGKVTTGRHYGTKTVRLRKAPHTSAKAGTGRERCPGAGHGWAEDRYRRGQGTVKGDERGGRHAERDAALTRRLPPARPPAAWQDRSTARHAQAPQPNGRHLAWPHEARPAHAPRNGTRGGVGG